MKKFIFLLATLLLLIHMEEIENVPVRNFPQDTEAMIINADRTGEILNNSIAVLSVRLRFGVYIMLTMLCLAVIVEKPHRKIVPANLSIIKFRKLCRKRLPRCSIDNRTFVRYNYCIATLIRVVNGGKEDGRLRR